MPRPPAGGGGAPRPRRASIVWRASSPPPRPELLAGAEGLAALAADVPADVVRLGAWWAAAGLLPTLAAIRAGRTIALANKETLVMAGALMTRPPASAACACLPVDSEHSALFQCLAGAAPREVRRLVLTASGGPFRGWSRAKLEAVTVEQALRHPTWRMGAKITIDSATLMNKGLEVIEARWLFDVPFERIAGRRASAVDRPLDGRVRRRLRHRAARHAGHGHPDPLRAHVSRAAAVPGARARPGRARDA